jgi:hypothetical protein
VDETPAAPPGAGLAAGRPFVVIRFNQSGVNYEPALREAMARALARRPNLGLDLVAVTPQAGSAEALAEAAEAAEAQADRVRRSLAEMGVPFDRIALMAQTDPSATGNEVRLYVR